MSSSLVVYGPLFSGLPRQFRRLGLQWRESRQSGALIFFFITISQFFSRFQSFPPENDQFKKREKKHGKIVSFNEASFVASTLSTTSLNTLAVLSYSV
jgi:hypothetical protein